MGTAMQPFTTMLPSILKGWERGMKKEKKKQNYPKETQEMRE
jgi:hypothetical protein